MSKFLKYLLPAAALMVAASALTGCFKNDYDYKSLYTVRMNGYTVDSATLGPVSDIRVIMFRKLKEEQTLATTPDSLICDTAFTDARGYYNLGEERKTTVSLSYALNFTDQGGRYEEQESEINITKYMYTFTGGAYTWNIAYTPSLIKVHK